MKPVKLYALLDEKGKFVEIKTTSGDIISIRKDTITSFQTSEVKND